MTALVTGATGFIGRALCERLNAEGARVRALARGVSLGDGPWPEVVKADLRLPLAADVMKGVDTVYHLAGKVHALSEIAEDPREYQELNVEGTRRLVDAAAANGVARFVYFSSVKAMGEGGAERQDESHPPQPTSAYGRSKLLAEEVVRGFGASGRHASILRLPLVYGAGNKGNLYRMVAAIDRGLFPPVPETGNGRTMAHVCNVVDAALLVASRPEANGEVFIVTDDRDYTTRELYDAIRSGLGRTIPGWSVPAFALRAAGRMGDLVGAITGRRAILDSDAVDKLLEPARYSAEKLAHVLGYRARSTFAEALPEILASYRAERAASPRPGQ